MRQEFIVPLFVLATLIISGLMQLVGISTFAITTLSLVGIVVGSWQLLKDTWESLKKKSFALDYIAILAITVGVITGNFIVAGVIVLMMSGGNALEKYAQNRAKKSLTALKNRIPNQAQVLQTDGSVLSIEIEKIPIGSQLLIRKGEVAALDGTLVNESAVFDESNLTGEPYPVSKQQGDKLHSGTINVGQTVTMTSTVISKDSTYHRIVQLVNEAENAKAPFIQLADQLSLWFTLLTLLIAGVAYLLSGDLERVLAVLVIATPCPLILATPIALIGGMNAAAQQRIIFKRLAALEILSRVKTMVFDKTGTITIGQPLIESISVNDSHLTRDKVLALAAGLERHSLHPYAKAIINYANHHRIRPVNFSKIEEKLGHGISGTYEGVLFTLAADAKHPDSQVVLQKNRQTVAVFTFKDELKKSSVKIIEDIQQLGLKLAIFTGDTAERAAALLTHLPAGIELKAKLSPKDKKEQLTLLKRAGNVVAMVGDGINDAPALATADVGLAFSHQEHTAASEAADVVLLGGNFTGVRNVLIISKKTMQIAKQSMYVGLGLSISCMILAMLGYLPPLAGAIGQEIIDVIVILNALRTTQIKTATAST